MPQQPRTQVYCLGSNPPDNVTSSTPALVFVDLDVQAETHLLVSRDDGRTWVTLDITANACPDQSQPPAPLIPRDSGYTLGKARARRQAAPAALPIDGTASAALPIDGTAGVLFVPSLSLTAT